VTAAKYLINSQSKLDRSTLLHKQTHMQPAVNEFNTSYQHKPLCIMLCFSRR